MFDRKYKFLLKKDPEDSRDLKFHASFHLTKCPPIVDTSTVSYMPSVFDQSTLGSCSANAIGNGYLYVHRKEGKLELNYIPSRLFIYYNERMAEGTINEDSGSTLRTGIKVINKYGVCHERLCPYIIDDFTKKPSDEAYKDGLNFQALAYKRISSSLLDMKSCLAEGYPFILGIQIYENFESDAVARNGIVPMPSGQCLGGHAVLAVGYNDSTKKFKIMNSWGTDWGDKGYFYLPYQYMENAELAMDKWTLRKVE